MLAIRAFGIMSEQFKSSGFFVAYSILLSLLTFLVPILESCSMSCHNESDLITSMFGAIHFPCTGQTETRVNSRC